MTSALPQRLTTAQFAEIASGYGSEQAVALLNEGQLGRRKVLLRAVSQELSERRPADQRLGGSASDRFDVGCALLGEIETRCPEAVTGRDGVLQHPYLGVWAMHLLRELAGGRARPDRDAIAALSAQISYFTALVAVAAARSGQPADLDVVIPAGGLILPTMGAIGVPGALGVTAVMGVARIQVAAGELRVQLADGSSVAVIEPTRVLAERPRTIRLEDLDPFRNAFGHDVCGRLDAAAANRWSRRLAAARQLISAHHARYLPGLAVGLSSITPLAPQPAGADASATSRHAFGAIATVLPPTTARLALLLIHEFQHAKLGGLMDLVPLHDDSDNRLYPAPWRPDPRPLGALLQGAYAHLGVADFWRLHRFSAGSAAAAQSAQEHFSRWRAHTASVVDVLLRSSALTSDGRRFVTAMATTVESW